MEPTTLLVLRETFANAILSVNDSGPAYPEHRDMIWHRVRQISEVTGSTPRTFLVRFLPGEPVEDGIYGDGWEQVATLELWVSYAGLGDDEDGCMIDADARQLTCVLIDGLETPVQGLFPVKYLGWSYVDDDAGKAYGYMTFAVRYLVSDRADGSALPP